MGQLRFILKVPYEEYERWPQFFELSEKDVGRCNINLLDEAIRFYNYPSGGHGGVYADPKDWPLFNPENISKAVDGLHEVLKKSITSMIGHLYTNITSQIKEEEKKSPKLGLHSERGKLCAELLISPTLRNEKKIKEIRKHPKKVHFREFEKLVVAMYQLRTLRPKEIENHISYQYKNSRLEKGGLNKALFEPVWGGSWIVKPKYIRDKIEIMAWNPEKPIWPYGPREVGPTEILYFSLQSTLFEKMQKVSYSQSANFLKNSTHPFLREVRSLCKSVEDIMPSYSQEGKSLQIWRQWERNLDYLAFVFDTASNFKDDAWVEWKTEIAIQGRCIEDYPCGVKVGLPAALGLIGFLQAYIADLKARTLMTALSSAIIDIYEETNGYTAMGLYEALTGRASIAPSGEHTVIDKNLVGSLKLWRTLPSANIKNLAPFWFDSEINQGVSKYFKSLLERPLISQKEWEKKPGYKKQKADIGNGISFDDFRDRYIPRYPVITKDFYKTLSISEKFLKNWFADERLYGARFEAQLHIYVAFQLLQKSREVLDWDWDKKEYKTSEDPKVLKKRRFLSHFFITAGSFVWGGRKPPHLTHRKGIYFDFIFGPDLVSWPEAKIADYILKLKRDKKGRGYLNKLCSTNPKYQFLRKEWKPKALVICYTKRQEGKKAALRTNRPHIVFRPLLRDEIVNVWIRKVKKFCTREKNGEVPYYSDNEKSIYLQAERQLTGTPHFVKTDDASSEKIVPEVPEEITELADWQRTHAGHLSILLSAPKLIVYASPIVHFRALHAIRQTLKMEGVFLFGLDCFDSYMNYLNDPESNKVPQELIYAFSEIKIPLSDDHRIEVVKENYEWVLTNYESKFKLKVSEDRLDVHWSVPLDLVNCFSELIRYSGFGFLPHNHHNHWHVEYHSGVSKPKSQSESEKFGTLLTKFKPIWLLLSVDLIPFRDYLSKYKTNDDPLLKEVANEKVTLLRLVEDYIQEFKNRYGNNNKKNLAPDQIQERTISEKFKEAIFSAFKEDSELIKPTIRKEHIAAAENTRLNLPVSEKLKSQIEISETLLFKHLIPEILRIIKPEDINFVEWSVSFVREQEPMPVIQKAIDVDEPEHDDFEEIID